MINNLTILVQLWPGRTWSSSQCGCSSHGCLTTGWQFCTLFGRRTLRESGRSYALPKSLTTCLSKTHGLCCSPSSIFAPSSWSCPMYLHSLPAFASVHFCFSRYTWSTIFQYSSSRFSINNPCCGEVAFFAHQKVEYFGQYLRTILIPTCKEECMYWSQYCFLSAITPQSHPFQLYTRSQLRNPGFREALHLFSAPLTQTILWDRAWSKWETSRQGK